MKLAEGVLPPLPVRPLGPIAAELQRKLRASPDPELAAFYAARDYRPIWIHRRALDSAAPALLEAVRAAGDEDLDPSAYRPERLAAAISAARGGGRAALAGAELELSRTLAAYGVDLHRPKPAETIVYTDPELQPDFAAPGAVLAAAGRARSMSGFLHQLERMSPLYEGLKRDLRAAPADLRPLIRLNLERARALPADLGPRFVWVDLTGGRLLAYDHGRLAGAMPVVVGKPNEPTPVMAALIRSAVFRPYWNVPPDLARESVAPKVLSEGPAYLAEHHLEPLSGWSPDARVLTPEQVDWAAVAAGRQTLRLRQSPGPDNMMGQVKFVFPNALGIYLHDTPAKSLFASGQRTYSSGCVRLQDAAWLARWLLGGGRSQPGGSDPEHRVDLPAPTPVYIVYFTAVPGPGGIERRPDPYGRDAAQAPGMAQG